MNESNKTLSRQVAAARDAALARPELVELARSEATILQQQLGGLENTRDRGMTSGQVDQAQTDLLNRALIRFRHLATLPQNQLHTLNAMPVPVAVSREVHARDVLKQAMDAGLQLVADRSGFLEVSPLVKMTANLRQMIVEFREELVALVRANIAVFAPVD